MTTKRKIAIVICEDFKGAGNERILGYIKSKYGLLGFTLLGENRLVMALPIRVASEFEITKFERGMGINVVLDYILIDNSVTALDLVLSPKIDTFELLTKMSDSECGFQATFINLGMFNYGDMLSAILTTKYNANYVDDVTSYYHTDKKVHTATLALDDRYNVVPDLIVKAGKGALAHKETEKVAYYNEPEPSNQTYAKNVTKLHELARKAQVGYDMHYCASSNLWYGTITSAAPSEVMSTKDHSLSIVHELLIEHLEKLLVNAN